MRTRPEGRNGWTFGNAALPAAAYPTVTANEPGGQVLHAALMPQTRRLLASLSFGFLLGAAVAAVIVQAAVAVGSTDTNRHDEPTITCQVETQHCQTGRTAVESLPYPWSAVGYDVQIKRPPSPWYEATTIHGDERIELYVDGDTNADNLARTLAHEIAHAILHGCGDERLDTWRDRRDLPASVPDTVPAPHDFDSVSEDAAEAFAQYLTGQPSRSTVGDQVTDDWLQANSELFAVCKSGDRD